MSVLHSLGHGDWLRHGIMPGQVQEKIGEYRVAKAECQRYSISNECATRAQRNHTQGANQEVQARRGP